MPYKVARKSGTSVSFRAAFGVTNYSGTRFEVKVDREVRLLTAKAALKNLGIETAPGVNLVAYESINKITNAGKTPWEKGSGLLSIWILGMFNPSPATTIIVPVKSGTEKALGATVTSDYFGKIPDDRLVVKKDVIYLSGDGGYRKILDNIHAFSSTLPEALVRCLCSSQPMWMNHPSLSSSDHTSEARQREHSRIA